MRAWLAFLAAVALVPYASALPPGAPANVEATWRQDMIDLTWDAVSGADEYRVLVDGELVGTTSSTALLGLSPGIVYEVRALRNGEEGPSGIAFGPGASCGGLSSGFPFVVVNMEKCKEDLCALNSQLCLLAPSEGSEE